MVFERDDLRLLLQGQHLLPLDGFFGLGAVGGEQFEPGEDLSPEGRRFAF